MADTLRDQLSDSLRDVVLAGERVADLGRRADAAAAQLVALCRERREAERQLERARQAYAILESAVEVAEQQVPLAKAFHRLGYNPQLLKEPIKIEVAKA